MSETVRSTAIIAAFTLLSGCGVYSKVAYMVPDPQDGWQEKYKSRDPFFRRFDLNCGNESISVWPMKIRERIDWWTFLWIPLIPGAPEQSEDTDGNPLVMRMGLKTAAPISCSVTSVALENPKSDRSISPISAHGDSRVYDDGTRYCIFTFPSISEIGAEFRLRVSGMVQCEVPPLAFQRTELGSWFSANAGL